MNRLYPIGIQNFEKLRRGGFVYVDKTALIHRLVSTGGYYFFGRPRRFGKSLMISTLESYFEGRKDLFEGLAIEGLEKEWNVHPVFHMDLNSRNYKDVDALYGIFNQHLEKWEEVYGDEKKDRAPEERFAYLIEKAAKQTGRGVVILIDEYDKPLIQSLDNEELQSEYRSILKSFYGNLKSCDKYIRFALLTGVTRFSRVSIFSDLNNLRDITMENEFASLCGISETELITHFESDIRELSVNMNLSYEETCSLLQKKYDGYHFTGNSEGMYNPFSVLNTFASMKIENYWFSTGTPTILVKLLQKNNYLLSDLTGNAEATADELTGLETINTNPIPLFFQSGYLTIKEYDPEFKNYILGFPNEEVEQGFLNFLMPCYMNMKIDSFMERLQSLFSDTPYELIRDTELHYQNVLFIVFRLMGFYTHAEYHTSQGRIDMVVKTPQYIYVMEFKFEGSAEDAIAQIESRNYALPFMSDDRKVYKIGVNFSEETRNIEKWIVAD